MREVQLGAVRTLAATLDGQPLPKAIAKHARHASASDQAAIRDVTHRALRNWGLLEAQLAQLIAKPLKARDIALLLKVACTQLRETDAPAHAIVHTAVALTDALGAGYTRGLVNGVLRSYTRQREALEGSDLKARAGLVASLNFPEWWIAEIRAVFPDQWLSLLSAQNEPPPLTLRVNARRTTRANAEAQMSAAGFTVATVHPVGLHIAPPRNVEAIPGFTQGEVSVQDAGAMLAAELLDVRDGMRVLDACAAPGGKTAHLLEHYSLDLLALDKDAERLARVTANLARLGLTAATQVADAAAIDTWWDGQPFDRILLDAPCSASGTARRNPDIRWSRRPTDLANFAATQARLLQAVWQTLAPGGKLLYATCSLFRAENADQAAQFARITPDARPLILDHPALIAGQVIPDALRDGFYYAGFEKQR
jgi:16S rRNA (cytosine967-C5)-methyltransferase